MEIASQTRSAITKNGTLKVMFSLFNQQEGLASTAHYPGVVSL